MTKIYRDCEERVLCNGDIINLHTSVNGQCFFIVLDVVDLDIRYSFDLEYRYEYCKDSLLSVPPILGYVEWEIIKNLNDEQ
tara:strand:- start:427 stop:669 length:243 start_codon:yes stop_codon:yes gene_type:complete